MKAIILATLLANPNVNLTRYTRSCMMYTLKTTRSWDLTKRDAYNFCKCVEVNLLYQHGTTRHISNVGINQHCREYMRDARTP